MRPTALLILAVLCAPAPAHPAERHVLPARPYDVVAVEPPQAYGDATFETFRKDLAAVAKSRLYADLARLVTPHGFFWDRDFAQAYDRRRPSVDNLAAAIRLEHEDGAGWERLARFAAETAVEAQPARPGTVCAPARPHFDVVAYTQLLDQSFTVADDWVFPRMARLPVRAAPQADARLVAELGLHFVRLLKPAGDEKPAAQHTRWVRVVTPEGEQGFVPPDSLGSLKAPQLCFGKDAFGRWQIVGFVAGG